MKIFSIFLLIFLLNSCSAKKEDPLLLPPKYDELPDPETPQKINPQTQEENVERLKELLLDSE